MDEVCFYHLDWEEGICPSFAEMKWFFLRTVCQKIDYLDRISDFWLSIKDLEEM